MIVIKEQLQPYLDADADLIPLHVFNKQTIRKGKTQIRGKTPIYGNWTKRDKNVKETLLKAKEGHNVGYRLGATDLIIDVDPRNFKDQDSLNDLCEFLGVEDLADICPTVLTGSGGYHYYMTKPANMTIRKATDKFKGIDFLTKGAQIVAAGSKHPNGNFYEWDDFAPEYIERPAAPKKLLGLLEYVAPEQSSDGGEITGEQLTRLLDQLPVEEFSEHDDWFKIMCAAHHGTAGSGINEFLEWSLSDLDRDDDKHEIKVRWDSLSQKPVSTTVKSLYKAVKAWGGDTNVVTAQEDFKGIGLDEENIDISDVVGNKEMSSSYIEGAALKLANGLSKTSTNEEIATAIRSALQSDVVEQGRAKTIICKLAGINTAAYNSIASSIKDQLIEDLGRVLAGKTLQNNYYERKGLIHDGQFWAYNGKYWEYSTPEMVGKNVLQVLDSMLKQIDINVKHSTIMGEAIKLMGSMCSSTNDPLGLTKEPKPIVNCKNGELWIKKDGTTKLRSHKPESRLLQILDVEYSPAAECPMFDQALEDIFAKFPDSEEMVRHFEEYMGYCLHPVKHKPYFWLFIGPGGDGKTTLLSVLSELLGSKASQSIKLDRFKSSGDNHAYEQLVGKSLVYQEDLGYGYKFPTDVVKDLCQSGTETANPKGRPAYQFKKVCTLTVTSNSYPKNSDFTEGFRRRAMVIPFNGKFHKTKNIIYNLSQKIAKSELAGVLNRALEGYKRLQERGDFDIPESCRIATDDWLSESNHIMKFVSEHLEKTDRAADRVKTVDLYSAFVNFCQDKNINRVPLKDTVVGMIKDAGYLFGDIGSGYKGFRFVKLNHMEEMTDDFAEDEL